MGPPRKKEWRAPPPPRGTPFAKKTPPRESPFLRKAPPDFVPPPPKAPHAPHGSCTDWKALKWPGARPPAAPIPPENEFPAQCTFQTRAPLRLARRFECKQNPAAKKPFGGALSPASMPDYAPARADTHRFLGKVGIGALEMTRFPCRKKASFKTAPGAPPGCQP